MEDAIKYRRDLLLERAFSKAEILTDYQEIPVEVRKKVFKLAGDLTDAEQNFLDVLSNYEDIMDLLVEIKPQLTGKD